jgi:chorismate dehydratase
MRTRDLRLGHIVYSNCFPVHARLLDAPRPGDPRIVQGIPSHLNRLLERGEIDVAPCSSIEFARHADTYRVLPELVIGAHGPVRSILLVSRTAPDRLGRATVALPTASATSVVLLKILLRERWAVSPEFTWFDQARDDPFASGAAAALFIGDVALRQDLHPDLPHRFDLGSEWLAHTGLPFAFAVWQARDAVGPVAAELRALLTESRAYGTDHRADLARRYGGHFGFDSATLDAYWRDLRYELDSPMRDGLMAFYRKAAAIGEIPTVPELRWLGDEAVG